MVHAAADAGLVRPVARRLRQAGEVYGGERGGGRRGRQPGRGRGDEGERGRNDGPRQPAEVGECCGECSGNAR